MPTTRTWTEAELMALPEDGLKRELVGGEIVVSPAGAPHGRVIVELILALAAHVKALRLGHVFDSSTGCWLSSGNLRVPDLCFVSRDRMPGEIPPGFLRVPPDLVVEVLSPGDSPREMEAKIADYLASGVRLAWILDPRTRRAAIHRPGAPPRDVDAAGDLDGEDVVPGFRCRLTDVLG